MHELQWDALCGCHELCIQSVRKSCKRALHSLSPHTILSAHTRKCVVAPAWCRQQPLAVCPVLACLDDQDCCSLPGTQKPCTTCRTPCRGSALTAVERSCSNENHTVLHRPHTQPIPQPTSTTASHQMPAAAATQAAAVRPRSRVSCTQTSGGWPGGAWQHKQSAGRVPPCSSHGGQPRS